MELEYKKYKLYNSKQVSSGPESEFTSKDIDTEERDNYKSKRGFVDQSCC